MVMFAVASSSRANSRLYSLSEVPTILYQEKVVEAWVGSGEICFSEISRCKNDDSKDGKVFQNETNITWEIGEDFHLGIII